MKAKKEKKPWSKKKKFFTGIVVILLLLGLLGSGGSDDSSSTNNPTETTTSNEPEEPKAEDKPQSTKYKASTYKVGSDIPAGEYIVYKKREINNEQDCYYLHRRPKRNLYR